jgi:nitrite reductase/ring-hydroxylating ferredoxin subunit
VPPAGDPFGIVADRPPVNRSAPGGVFTGVPASPDLEETPMTEMTRRAMLGGAAGVCAAALLGACGSDDGDDSGSGTDAKGGAATGAAGATTPAGGGGANALGSTSEVPVGGGKVFPDQKILVTQPTAGQYKAFSAVCPHAGRIVSAPVGGTVTCPFHGSRFSATDGSLQGGPATKGLTAKAVKAEGGQLVLE